MRVHVVAPYTSFAMQQLVLPLTSCNLPWLGVSVGKEPDWTADLNYFIPALGMYDVEPQGKAMMYYTHTNPGQEEKVKEAAGKCEMVVSMSTAGRRELLDLKVKTPIVVIPPGIDFFGPRKRNIIIVGAEQPNGRKRSHLLLDLAWSHDLTPFHFVIIGTGWSEVVGKLRSLGVSVTYEPTVDAPILQHYYQSSDVFLATGYREGGPMPLLEALASGLPVITPNFGLATELSKAVNITFYSSADDLYPRLMEFWEPINRRCEAVKHFTPEMFKILHRTVFQNVLDVPMASRYEWLLNIIDEIKPSSILEVGTHRGDSAEKMIKTAQIWNKDVRYYGYDLFEPLSDAEMARELSKQPPTLGEVMARLQVLSPNVVLTKGDTRETLAYPYSGGPVDLIYIDGGHSWETIESDWRNLQRYIGPKTVIVFDDYYTDHEGEHGCQKLVDSLDLKRWNVTILPPTEIWGELKINMVRVQRRR